MIEFAKKTAQVAYEASRREGEIADHIRAEFDREYGHVWNVVVGRHFGTDVRNILHELMASHDI